MFIALKEALLKYKKLKVLGLCFGHQALAKMYGGKVDKYNLYAGIEKIQFRKEKLLSYPYFSNILKFDHDLFISEYHGDSVSKIPNSFISIAGSDSCIHESMISEDGRCLSFQFHAEYTNSYTRGY